jgi:GTP-binding protein
LFELRNTKKVVAENGKNGIGGNLFGKNAEDLFIHVPIGCSVYDSQTNELLADIIEDGQTYTVCHGGMGGHGNTFFKSSFNRIPTLYENGELGEERNVVISLKFFADVGLVGLPNAGKSTLISQISNANPKIANYQFTTLNPVLGIVKHNNMQLVFEDIPGLIEGANTGKGLGHDFLKHVERCHILLHLISLSEFDNENPYEAYETINNELQLYSKDLVQKEILVVGNKIDTPNAQEALKSLEKKLGKKIFAISALEKINTTELVNYIFDKYAGIIKELRENQITKMREIKYEGRLQERKLPQDTTVIKNSDGEYVVVSEYVDY